MSELSKRELLAGMAMQGIISNAPLISALHKANLKEGYGERTQGESITTEAVAYADALLAELARTEPKQAEPDNDRWIAHATGGEMPCDGKTFVRVKFRDSDTSDGFEEARHFDWGHEGKDFDIIAWRPAR